MSLPGNSWRAPEYEPLFPLGRAFEFGCDMQSVIDESIYGVAAGKPEDYGILAQAVAIHGDHLELGTLFGATAVLVAMVKREFSLEGGVTCVDNFQMFANRFKVGPETVRQNATLFGLKVNVVQANTNPLPVDGVYSTCYIDADHSYRGCAIDWDNARDVTTHRIIFHDADKGHPGVVGVVREPVPDWGLVYLANRTAIMEREDA